MPLQYALLGLWNPCVWAAGKGQGLWRVLPNFLFLLMTQTTGAGGHRW